ncbi:MAG: hypothetical protein Q7U86_06195, partial [Draconibacterium sp.]|nr:hypothetical protein [Draconibacterium sp.]
MKIIFKMKLISKTITINYQVKCKNLVFALLFMFLFNNLLVAQQPILSWDFNEVKNRTILEQQSGIADTLEGYFNISPGITGNGLRLDGFTTRLIHNNPKMSVPGGEITVEAWVSLGEYPWNWCPVLTTETDETKGYRLMIGPHGEASMQVAIGEQWIS